MSAADRVVYWQRRARDAEWRIHAAERDSTRSQEWAREILTEERRLWDRCTYLYGLAARFGASDEELRGPVPARETVG